MSVDGVGADGAGHGHPVVAVSQIVEVVDPVDGDRWQRRSALGVTYSCFQRSRLHWGGRNSRSNAAALWGSVVPAIEATAIAWTPSRRRGAVAAQPMSSARYASGVRRRRRPPRRSRRARERLVGADGVVPARSSRRSTASSPAVKTRGSRERRRPARRRPRGRKGEERESDRRHTLPRCARRDVTREVHRVIRRVMRRNHTIIQRTGDPAGAGAGGRRAHGRRTRCCASPSSRARIATA